MGVLVKGFWTFQRGGKMSIIDYALVGKKNLEIVEDFRILDKGQHLLDTDHSPLLLIIKDDDRGVDNNPILPR